MYNIKRKEYISMHECSKDCLSFANSFSEQGDENEDILIYMEHDEMIADEN